MLIGLLSRILSGEPYRKATPRELRWYSALFALLPVWLVIFVYVGKSWLDHASGIGIGLYLMGSGLGGLLILAMWARFVPAKISWLAAAVIWSVTLYLAITGKLFFHH